MKNNYYKNSLFLILVLFLALTGCQEENRRSPDMSSIPSPAHFTEGKRHLDKGDFQKAVDSFNAAIKENPETEKEAFLYLAYALFLNNQPGEAGENLSRWKTFTSNNKTPVNEKNTEDKLKINFMVFMIDGKYDEALKEAEKLEKKRGVSPALEKGFAYFYQGNINKAGEIFEEIEDSKHMIESDRETAAKMVDIIENAEKSSSSGKAAPPSRKLEKKTKSHIKSKRAASSLFTPIPAEKQVEGKDYALMKKGDGFFISGKFKEALECYLKVLENNPQNDDALVRAGDIYLRTAQYEKSGEAFDKALKLNPRNKYARFGYADILMEKGEYTEAEKHLRKALEIDENFAAAYTTIGDIYVDTGDYENAEKAFLKSLEADPLQKYPDTYIGLGELYFKKDELEKSLQCFKKAQEKDPFDKDVFLGAAKTLIRMERYGEAEANFEKALKLVPDDPDLGTEYTGFCIGTKRFKRAEELLKHFLKKYPDDEDFMKLKEKLEEEKRRKFKG
jgi:tetratricopeptide (TPR) repeat protein